MVGSCRCEILGRITPVNEKHLFRVVREYVGYHDEDRITTR